MPAGRSSDHLGQRTWFRALPHADLQLWHTDGQALVGVDLSYRQGQDLKLLRWRAGRALWHGIVNEGEDRPRHHKASAMLEQQTTADWPFLQAWLDSASGLPPRIHMALMTVLRLRPPDAVPLD